MTSGDVLAWLSIGGGLGVFGYVGQAWVVARRRQRRLAEVYRRYSAEPETVTVHAITVPPRRPEARAWVGWQSRRPTRMNLPVARPVAAPAGAQQSDWVERALDVRVHHHDPRGFDPELTLPFRTDDDEER